MTVPSCVGCTCAVTALLRLWHLCGHRARVICMTERLGSLERRKIRTRRALIETAVRLFREQGYEATTLAQICEGAEIGDRTFFNYFDGKDDLVFFDDKRRLDRSLEVVAARGADD